MSENKVEFDSQKHYTIEEACELLPQLSTSKFEGSVDVDVILKKGKKKNQEAIRGSVVFPHGFGEKKRVILFGDEQSAKEAKAAGAIEAGLDELITKVEKGSIDFDVVLATPDVMPKIAKLGRYLGPKGLMPNPSNGTITKDVKNTVGAYLSGKQDFKMNEQQAVRGRVAKLGMKPAEIADNLVAFLKNVANEGRKIDPQPFTKIVVSPTMGKGVKLDINSVTETIKG